MPNTKSPKSKPRLGFEMLMNIAVAMIVVFCTVSIISVQNTIVEKKAELAALEENIEVLQAENQELADLIESDNIGKYIEKLALENEGYAYPDERRYHDTSRE